MELLLEKGKLPLAEYAVKEAKLLAYKLVADYEQLAEEGMLVVIHSDPGRISTDVRFKREINKKVEEHYF